MSLMEDCQALAPYREGSMPPYYLEIAYPEDIDERGAPVTIYEPSPEVLTVLWAQDVAAARLEAQARWDAAQDERAIGYLVWQSDWTVVGGIDRIEPSLTA